MDTFSIKDFDPTQSLYIEASAGTGKTYTIQQIVARLIKDGTKLGKILIVTYTEKAAGELKDRIRKKIREVLDDRKVFDTGEKELTSDEVERFETALRDIDGAQIYTIHSFCQKTLKTYAYDAGRPFDMQLIDDAAVKNLIQRNIRDEWPKMEEYKAIFGESTKDSNNDGKSVFTGDAFDSSNDGESEDLDKTLEKLEKILVNAIPKYYLDKDGNENHDIIQLLPPKDPIQQPEQPPFYDIYKNLSNKNDLFKLDGFETIYNTLQNYKSIQCGKIQSGQYKGTTKKIEELCDLIDNWKGGKIFNKGDFPLLQRWPQDLIQSYNNLLKINENICKCDKYINDLSKYNKSCALFLQCTFLYKELPILYQEWRTWKAEHKYESYQDMIQAVHQAVVLDENALKDRLRETYDYAIIDEFQDTNRLQWDIFRKVFLGDDKDHPVPNHSLFVVGDPKQSIYAFQGADLTVYQDAIKTIAHGKSLNTNFRSTKEIIEACNLLFAPDKGSQFFANLQNDDNHAITFFPSKTPSENDPPIEEKHVTYFENEECKPIWLSKPDISADDFALFAANQIVECCIKDGEKTKLQVFDKSNTSTLRNVTFKDFAILARTRSEFPPIEAALKRLGIPFVHYKDKKLFDSRECMQWMALFRAIDADDFSAYNRRILNEALMTDFFLPFDERIEDKQQDGIDCYKRKDPQSEQRVSKLYTANAEYYDDPECPERRQLAQYHALARKYRWAELLECIYRTSLIETRTAGDLSKLQSLAKFQQIGNYCVEFLYAHRCGIEDLIKHLGNLQQDGDKTSDEDGNLVARATDFDAVQLMTIHASKGLEFPVVICVGGFKKYNDNAEGPFDYHENGCKYLRFDKDEIVIDAKHKIAKHKRENIEEWKRLFYVAYTRASSLLILPRYKKFSDSFLKSSIDAFSTHDTYIEKFDSWKESDVDEENLKEEVKKILGASNVQDEDEIDISEQNKAISALHNSLGKKSLIQHSYSSLSAKAKRHLEVSDANGQNKEEDDYRETEPSTMDANGKSLDFASDGDNDEPKELVQIRTESRLDPKAKQVLDSARYETGKFIPADDDYPRGRHLGDAIHEVLETMEFTQASRDIEQFVQNKEVRQSIEQVFNKYALPINSHPHWVETTARIVWHTLNAILPLKHHPNDNENDFALRKLENDAHFPEVEFMLEGQLKHDDKTELKQGEYFSKGFIDLMFVREVNGIKKYYYILDWKSDRMENEDYANPEALKIKVDDEYAVQRVLYSYCLIDWLKQFYSDKSHEQIFNDHFGGIYYAFVRGCYAGTSNGIYAQTWDSYDTLKKSYGQLRSLMFQSADKENKNND